MKHLFPSLLLALTTIPTLAMSSGAPATPETFSAGIVAYKACSSFPDSITFSEKPNYCMNSEGQSVVSLIIKGKDIIGISADSLKVNALTLSGKDLSKTRTGKPAYSLGSFPSTSETGEFVIFDFEMKNMPFGQFRNSKFDGSIDLLISDKLMSPKQSVETSKPFEIKMGPYTVTNKKQLDASIVGNAMGQMLMGGDDSNSFPVKVIGNLEALSSLEVTEGDKKVNSSWSTSHDNKKTFHFDKPTLDTVNIELQYWDNLQKKTISLKF